MGGYLICKLDRGEVEREIKVRLWYDEDLSKALKLSIFWVDEKEIKKELQEKVRGRFFTIDEIVIYGIKYASEFTDLSQIKG